MSGYMRSKKRRNLSKATSHWLRVAFDFAGMARDNLIAAEVLVEWVGMIELRQMYVLQSELPHQARM